MRELDPSSKSDRIVFIPKTPEEHTLSKNFKKLCNRDELQGHDALLEALNLFFKKHNWEYGGNTQTTMNHKFPLPQKICDVCHKPVHELKRVLYVSGRIAFSCQQCLDKDKRRGVVKKAK
jgi:hypothetical protein